MWNRLMLLLALAVPLAAIPAHASETRVNIFTIACDGTNKHVDFIASGLNASVTRFIQGVEVTVIDTRGGLLYVVVRALGDEKKQLITTGPGSTSARAEFTGFFQVTTDASGNVPFTIDAACTPGGSLQGVVTIGFFS